MSEVFAFSDENKVGLHLEEFRMEPVASLTLTDTRYLLFAKVVLDNADGDSQNASAQLRRQEGDSFVTLDETSVRLFESGDPNRTEISLQAAVDFDDLRPPVKVELACATFDGNASQAQLAALHLDFLNNLPG